MPETEDAGGDPGVLRPLVFHRTSCASRRIGYVRRLVEIDALESSWSKEELGCDQVFEDDLNHGSSEMPGLVEAMRQLRRGDTLVIRKLRHLGFSTKSIVQVLEHLDRNGVQLCSMHDGIEDGSQMASAITRVGAVFAEMQRELKRERTRLGQRAASAAGRLKGARRTISPKMLSVVRHLMTDTDLTMTQIAQTMGTTRNTLYRSLKRSAPEQT